MSAELGAWGLQLGSLFWLADGGKSFALFFSFASVSLVVKRVY